VKIIYPGTRKQDAPTAFSFHSPLCTWQINCSIIQGWLNLWKCINYLSEQTLIKGRTVWTSHLTVTVTQNKSAKRTIRKLEGMVLSLWKLDTFSISKITNINYSNIHNGINEARNGKKKIIFNPCLEKEKRSTAGDDRKLSASYLSHLVITCITYINTG